MLRELRHQGTTDFSLGTRDRINPRSALCPFSFFDRILAFPIHQGVSFCLLSFLKSGFIFPSEQGCRYRSTRPGFSHRTREHQFLLPTFARTASSADAGWACG